MNILSSLILTTILMLIFAALSVFSHFHSFTLSLLASVAIAFIIYVPLFLAIRLMSNLQYKVENSKRNDNIKHFLKALDVYRVAFEDARFYHKSSKTSDDDGSQQPKEKPRARSHHLPTRPEDRDSPSVVARERFYMRACASYQKRRYNLDTARVELDKIFHNLIGFYGIEHKRVDNKLKQLKRIEGNWKNWYGQWLNSVNPYTRFHLDKNDLKKAQVIINDQNAHSQDTTNPVSINFAKAYESLRQDLQSILDYN